MLYTLTRARPAHAPTGSPRMETQPMLTPSTVPFPTLPRRALALGGVLGAVLLAGSAAQAQLTPDRTYYGLDRAIPMTVAAPAGASSLKVELLAPVTAEVKATADVVAGGVDLAGLFPVLWKPEGLPTLCYAQLVADGKKIGPAVVLQPMVNPPLAWLQDPRNPRGIQWQHVEMAYSGIRACVDQHVVLETDKGEIEFRMRPDQAPNTAWNFVDLVRGGFYTDIVFHRIVPETPNGAFVIQVGDPTGVGNGGPGYNIDLEESKLPHDFGVLSMARSPNPNSNGSQVFICLSRAATQPLDGLYTSFAEAVRGADVIQAIAATKLDEQMMPVDPPRIVKARLVPAPPYGDGPGPLPAPSTGETPR